MSASASSASSPGRGELAAPGEHLGPGGPPPGLGCGVVGHGGCLGFFGHLLRLVEAALCVERLGEHGGDAARYPRSPMAWNASYPSLQ